jgi:uncharacterized membrane protein
MPKNRLEAFSDGVIAIIITIMVLELHVPEGGDLAALQSIAPTFLSYVVSFLYLAIYWNNHHHLLQAVHRVNGRSLWANTHLLFWLSLLPFATAWTAESHAATIPVALYGVVLLLAGFAYYILSRTLISHHGQDSMLATAIGTDRKGRLSLVAYLVAVGVAFLNVWISQAIYVAVAIIWLIPDRRIERVVGHGA